MPLGIDAAVSEGWLDLKVRNGTNISLQIIISFDESNISGEVLSNVSLENQYIISNKNVEHYHEKNKIFKETDIFQYIISMKTGMKVTEKII